MISFFHHIESVNPWDHVEIDLIGPLPESSEGYQYILTVMDVFTGFTVLRAAKTTEMAEITKLMWDIMCNFGTMKILQSDNVMSL